MKKKAEFIHKIRVQRPTNNIFIKIWRFLTFSSSVIYIPASDDCPHPLSVLLKHYIPLYSNPFVAFLVELPVHYDAIETTYPLPKQAGNGWGLAFIKKSPNGSTVLAKAITRLEGDTVRLSLYFNS